MSEQEGEIERVVVEFIQDGGCVVEVEYVVIDPPRESLRLAWISSRGGVEHYTFPHITARELTSAGSDVGLKSALEGFDMRRALAEIAQSPKLWAVVDGEYDEVELVSEYIEVKPRAELSSVELKVRLQG